jgi:N-acetylglucosamine-6-sulfatase
VVLALAVGGLLAAAPGAHAARPNVVIVLTDDQRWDTVSAMPTVRSELVDKGVTFSNAFVVNPLCCPSRASILTGKYSHSTRIYTNGAFRLFDDSSTLATWLRRAGYRTGFFGKYLNAYAGRYVPPGWSRWVGFTPANVDNYFDYGLNLDGTLVQRADRPEDYSTDVLAAEAEAFVRSNTTTPFFLLFAPYSPHNPATPAPRHEHAFPGLQPWRPASYNEPDTGDKPAWVRAQAQLSPESQTALDGFRARQLRSLLSVDDAVEQLLDALADTGRLEDTLVIFMSDNGLLWGEHRLTGKQAPYEESIRIPFVVRFDGLATGVRTETRQALNVDVAPTVAALAGVGAPGAEGRSLVPLLQNRPVSWRGEFLVESQRTGPNPDVPAYCTVRGRRYVYVAYSTQEEELYDLAADPRQLDNRVRDAALAPILAQFRKHLLRLCQPRPRGLQLSWICTKTGTPGNDVVQGTQTLDSLCGRAGRDVLRGRGGHDRLWGNRDRDVLIGGAGNDILDPGPSIDRVFGDDGADRLLLRDGVADIVSCGAGRDVVFADRRDKVAKKNCEVILRR